MDFTRSTPLASRFESLEECGSTNTELVARAADAWPDFSVLVTTSQTAGRGRLDRVWVAPPGQALAVSVLLRPAFATDAFGWLPLIAGLAMARAVDAVAGRVTRSDSAGRVARSNSAGRVARSAYRDHPTGSRYIGSADYSTNESADVSLKWPNDVLVDGLKVSGLLAELLPAADGVVLGAGLNLSIPRDALPTPQSTSLTLHGADADDLADRALAAYLTELAELYRRFSEHAGDAEASGIRRLVVQRCSTVGQQVRVELPGGVTRFGRATDIDPHGRLVFVDRADTSVQTVAAGDVTHVRYE